MQFLVTNAARECGVVNPVICVIENVKMIEDPETNKVYDAQITELMDRIADIRKEILNTDEVQGFRELLKTIGREVVPAAERLLNSCEKKKNFPRYGNLVDAYNIVALRTLHSFGMHDAKELLNGERTLIFRRASGDEKIVPSYKTKEETIPQGDFTYGIEVEGRFIPFAWLGKKDVDSDNHKLGQGTTSMLFTAIGNKHTSMERNMQLCDEVFQLIQLTSSEASMQILKPTFFN